MHRDIQKVSFQREPTFTSRHHQMTFLKTNFAKLTGSLNHKSKAYLAMILLKIVELKGVFLVLFISMGALFPVSAATSWKVLLEVLLVNKAKMICFSSLGFMLNESATLLLP